MAIKATIRPGSSKVITSLVNVSSITSVERNPSFTGVITGDASFSYTPTFSNGILISSGSKVGVGVSSPLRTFDMDGHFRLKVSRANRTTESVAVIKSDDKTAADLRVDGPIRVAHDLFKQSGVTGGFADNSNHFHTVQTINRITQQGTGEVKNIERVQEQYYAIQDNNLKNSKAAFWNWHRVSREIDITAVSLTNLVGWNVSAIQNSNNRLANQQKFFKDSENTIFTFDSQANREAVLSLNELLQVNIDIDFPGAIVAASLFAKVTGVSGATANVKLFGGNYKSTSEVAKASSQTALTTNFSVNKINTGSYMSLAGGTGVDALLDSTRTTTTDTFSLSFASPHNLELNDTITLITNSTKGFKAAEVAFVKEKTSTTQAKFVYGRVFEPASNLNLGDLSPSSVVGVLKGSIDPLHDFTAGDQLMHFNADNAGRYKSYQIGPGSEVGADCIAIGKNVYNNQASSIKIGYDNNMLNIHSTGIDVAGKVKTTGIINGSTHATAEPITYDAKEHRFRDFDTNPNNLMVISKRDGSPIGKIGINKDCPVSALHIVGGSTTGGGISNEALRVVGSGLFTSTNDTALILQADSNNNCPVENPILRLRQDGFASSTKREVDVGINSNNNSHFRGAKKDAFYIHRKAGTGETHNTPSIQFAIDENDVMTLRGGTTSDNAKVGINTNSPSVELDIRGNSGNGIAKMRILGAASETAEIEAGGELKIGSDGTNGYITAPRYALHVGAQTSNIGIHANLVGTTNNYPSDLTAHPYIRFVKSDSGNANFNRGIEFNGPVTSHVRFFRLGKGIQNYNSGGAHLPLPDIAGAKSTDMGGGISIVNAEVNAPDTNGAQQNFKAAHYHGIGIWSTNQFDVSSKGKLVRIYTNSPSNTSPTLQVATDVVTILKLVLPNIPTHANETAAASAGLAQNTVYKTSTGELRIKL